MNANEGSPGGGRSPVERLARVAAESGDARQSRPPVVGEVGRLAAVLDLVALADQAVAEAVEHLIDLRESGEVEAATGVNAELWLAQVARRTRSDVRMLLCAAELLPRLPGIRQAFGAGRLSWSQVRAVLLELRRLPVSSLDDIDGEVCAWLEQVPDVAPDEITNGIARIAWDLDERGEARRLAADERAAQAGEFFAMQPRLDGSGGRVWGEFAAEGFATLDAALNHDLAMPAGRGSFTDAGDRAAQALAAGRQRARRLVALADHHLVGCDPETETDAGALGRDDTTLAKVRGAALSRPSRPAVLLRTTLDTLLGGAMPGDLLTHLTGGRMQVTSDTARRLMDEAGADVRLVVLDDHGAVVGVGDRCRVPPGFVSDVALAMSATCEAPGCTAPARVGQDDHARPWVPVRPGERGGSTDVANNGRLCARHNVSKERGGWRCKRMANGVRRWRHERSGLTATHVPDHWEPDGHDPPAGPAAPSSPTRTVSEWLHPPDPDLPF